MKCKYREGDEVYWNDPDNGFSSGYYEIVDICGEVITINNGCGEAEVFEHELE